MTDYVFDGNADNFQQLVLDNSARGPVLVNFWSTSVGPCLRVWDTLKALVASYNGQFLLVNINTDNNRELVNQLGVNSLPTVNIYRDAEVVHRIHGAESEKSFIEAIDKFLIRPSDKILDHAMQCYQSGEQDKAISILAELTQADPGNMRVPVTMTRMLIAMKQYQTALDYIEGLAEDMQQLPEIGAMLTHMEILLAAGDDEAGLKEKLSQEENPEWRFRLAANYVVDDKYQQALEQLMQIVEQHRDYKNDIGRRCMLALFDLLGRDHPLTREYWSRLGSYLH